MRPIDADALKTAFEKEPYFAFGIGMIKTMIDKAKTIMMPEKAHILTVKELRKLPRTSGDAIPVMREERTIFNDSVDVSVFAWIGSDLAWEQYNDTLRCAKQGKEWYVLGKSLRFWSARPTREQLEEAEWDG
jgi:hypothetical protein